MPENILPFPEPPPPTSEYPDAAPPPSTKAVLWASTASWVEADIPKRPWVVQGYLMRGSVTIMSGAGSAGKSTIVKAWAVSAITAIPFNRFLPPAPLRVLSYNVEDDRYEEWRRFSATLRQFNKTPSDLDGDLLLVGPNDIGTLIERTIDGRIRLTQAMEELDALIADFKPDIVFLDPLVELHTSDENDNTGLRAVIAQLRQLARRHNIAVAVLHHTRKGTTSPGDPDSSRGAGAIVGAARIVFTVCPMSDDEAKELGIPADNRKTFFRLDGAKMNYSPTGDPEWFQRIAYELDNDEAVAAAVPWNPPRKIASQDELLAILQAIATANPPASSRLSTEARSFSNICLRFGFKARDDQRTILSTLKATSGIVEAPFTRPGKSKGDTAMGLRTSSGEPSTAPWEDLPGSQLPV